MRRERPRAPDLEGMRVEYLMTNGGLKLEQLIKETNPSLEIEKGKEKEKIVDNNKNQSHKYVEELIARYDFDLTRRTTTTTVRTTTTTTQTDEKEKHGKEKEQDPKKEVVIIWEKTKTINVVGPKPKKKKKIANIYAETPEDADKREAENIYSSVTTKHPAVQPLKPPHFTITDAPFQKAAPWEDVLRSKLLEEKKKEKQEIQQRRRRQLLRPARH
jgi:hypothetical protein